MRLLKDENNPHRVTICVNNHATIKATVINHAPLSHHLIDGFHAEVDRERRRHPRLKVTMRWAPGHVGIAGNERADEEAKRAGNERADEEAKRAATEGSSAKRQQPPTFRKALPTSKSAAKQVFNKWIKNNAEEQ